MNILVAFLIILLTVGLTGYYFYKNKVGESITTYNTYTTNVGDVGAAVTVQLIGESYQVHTCRSNQCYGATPHKNSSSMWMCDLDEMRLLHKHIAAVCCSHHTKTDSIL